MTVLLDVADIMLKPVHWLVFYPTQKALQFGIYRANNIGAKKKHAKTLAKDPRSSLDIYNPILQHSATELARMIRTGEVTSRQVVAAYIERIKQVNPLVNGLVADRFDKAIEDAEAVDKLVATGDLSAFDSQPFLGVPITIKESIAVEGLPNTYGLFWRQKQEPVSCVTSKPVQNIIDAGFIILGVTNTPTLSTTVESDNAIYGRTLNPYNFSLTPGGSSSGEGALLGSGASPVGIATDIGGSIPIPSLFCGVFGHRPTAGMIPHDLTTYPELQSDNARSCFTKGVMCRYAEDIAPTLSILASQEIGDPSTVDFSELNVMIMPEGLGNSLVTPRVSKELRDAVVRAGKFLGGSKVKRVKPFANPLTTAFKFMPVICDGEVPVPATLAGENQPPVSASREALRILGGKSQYSPGPLMFAVSGKLLGGKYADVTEYWAKLKQQLDELLGENGILIMPPQPKPAQRHGWSLTHTVWVAYTAIFNALGYPVTHVPMGLNKKGVPIGVMVVARKNQDIRTIAAAVKLQEGFGGWVPPTRLGVPV
ncbi:Fatty-acid amide hydrolase 2 [Linderina pennispora]|nr:Fatty-acid amide hydrolase 2 [Linderina pennispora]